MAIAIVKPLLSHFEATHQLYEKSIRQAFVAEGLSDQHPSIELEVALKKSLLWSSLIENNGDQNYGDSHQFLIALETENSREAVVGAISYGPLGAEIRSLIDTGLYGDWVGQGIGELGSLYVCPQRHNQGIGSALINGMLLLLKAQGIETFALDSGYKLAQAKWIHKFGTPEIIAPDFWGPSADHMVWKCDLGSIIKLEFRQVIQTELNEVLNISASEKSYSQYATLPANIDFDIAINQLNKDDFYDQYRGLYLNGNLLGCLMFEKSSSELNVESGYFEWVPVTQGYTLTQPLLKYLFKLYPNLNTTMAPLSNARLYEGLGWHLGSYARYLGVLSFSDPGADTSGISADTSAISSDPSVMVSVINKDLQLLQSEHSIVIRKLTASDIESNPSCIEQICRLIDFATGDKIAADSYMAMTKLPDLEEWIAITKESIIIAYAGFWYNGASHRGVLEPVACLPEWRSKGITKALLQHGINSLKAQGCISITVGTSQGNVASQALYSSVGFKRSDWLATYVNSSLFKNEVNTLVTVTNNTPVTVTSKRAIVFDLYGTLVDIHTQEDNPLLWENFSHYYNSHVASGQGLEFATAESLKAQYLKLVEIAKQAKFIELTQQKSALSMANPVRNEQIDYDGISIDHIDIELLDVFSALGFQHPQEAATLFRSLSRKRLKVYPGVIELLELIKAKGYKRILLSNAQACFTHDELRATKLNQHLDAIYLSSDYGCCKPFKGYFELMLAGENLTPGDCIFVGNDHIADLGGAHAVGMPCLYLHTECSQAKLPDWLPAELQIFDGDVSRLHRYLLEVL